MVRYAVKVWLLRTPLGNRVWRWWRAWRGDVVGDYARLSDYVRRYAHRHGFR